MSAMHWEARRRQSALDRRTAQRQQQVNNMWYKEDTQRPISVLKMCFKEPKMATVHQNFMKGLL